MLFRQWSNFNYLLDFFFANMEDLQGFFKIEKISDAIKDTMEDAEELERLILDFPYTEQLDGLFHPLSLGDNRAHELLVKKQGIGTGSRIQVGFASMLFASNRMCISSQAVPSN